MAAAEPLHPPMGVEVPIIGSDRLSWVDVTVPSPIHIARDPPPSTAPSQVDSGRGVASCHVIPGDPPSYVVWRIHDNRPDALELIDFCPSKEFPEQGIRLIFYEPLHPFSFVYNDQAENGNIKMVYAVSCSGTAYLLSLKNASAYLSGSIFPINDLTVQDVQSHSLVTAVASVPGCLVVGRQDGSISCYRLGSSAHVAAGFILEYRDNVGLGRLWNLMSRGRAVGPVQHIVISECFGRNLLFAAHLDGILRVWDLVGSNRLFNQPVTMQESSGSTLDRIWVGDANYETGEIIVVALFRSSRDVITVHSLDYTSSEKLSLSQSSSQCIPLKEGRVIDLKILGNDIWVLEEDGSFTYSFYCSDIEMENYRKYDLHENFISHHLLQGSKHSLEASSWSSLTLLTSIKGDVSLVISSVFLDMLFKPGIFLKSALHATILDLKERFSHNELQSLSNSELRREILSIIDNQGKTADVRSVVLFWKKFCAQYMRHWCQNNGPFGLFVGDSAGPICLIRKSSISLFRQAECSFANLPALMTPLLSSSDGSSSLNEVVSEMFNCLNMINSQFGTVAAAVFFDCTLDPSSHSCEVIVLNLVKEMNMGCYSAEIRELVGGIRDLDHVTHRKFAVHMFASLHRLLFKATTWDRVLVIIAEHLKSLYPNKGTGVNDNEGIFNINSCLLLQAACQISMTTFEHAFSILIFLGFLIIIGPQILLPETAIARIRTEMMPIVWDIITCWHIVHFLLSASTELPAMDDFSSKLSLLYIDGISGNQTVRGKMRKSAFPLAFLLDLPVSAEVQNFIHYSYLPNPSQFVEPVKYLCNRIIWRETDTKPNSLFISSIELSCILLRDGQFGIAEKLLAVVNAHLSRRTVILGGQDAANELSACLHLLGFCILVRAQDVAPGAQKEWRIRESIRCFFRASYVEGAFFTLRNLSFQAGLVFPSASIDATSWKLFYYQWAMQLFEKYNLFDAACEFALAALEQIDEAFVDGNLMNLAESPSTVKGRLWANVFKFCLDLHRYSDAYCAIISNPDDDSKSLCLRRFIIVLIESNEVKVLCNGGLPFVGLTEKIEKELIWKAEQSDVSSNPNLYKLLYGFEIYLKNWRKAATYMYQYSVRLRHEASKLLHHQKSLTYQEVLCALSASINALQLVNPSQAWIDSQQTSYSFLDASLSNKKARILSDNSIDSQKLNCFIDIEMLENEYVLTLAQHALTIVNAHCSIVEPADISKAVDALVHENFFDIALTIVTKFFKDSKLRSELERVFIAISQKCCANYFEGSLTRIDMPRTLLLSSNDEACTNGEVKKMPSVLHQCAESPNWEMLERYLGMYKRLHPRLPVTVAETLLYSNPQIELPLWLVLLFKGERRATPWGMTGKEADPGILFRLYVDYERYTEAVNLLLEYLEAFASLRPIDVCNRKRMSAVWFPYVTIERLVWHLEELQCSGHMVDQCNRLKDLLHGALQKHIKQIKIDSEDALVPVPA